MVWRRRTPGGMLQRATRLRGEAAVERRHAELEGAVPVSGLLGYLNFSDGRPDPRWQKQLNDAYSYYAASGAPAPWQALLEGLAAHLDRLQSAGSAAFRDVTQARAVLGLAAEVLPAYRLHHADLLAHVSDAELFGPFFLARVGEAILQTGVRGQESGVSEVERSEGAPALTPDSWPLAPVLARLNDFVGHRPIAILETRPQGEPYEHERHRPLPLYLRGAGVAWGRYHDVVARALDILAQTEPGLLAEASFDLNLLDELAVDLRAYDHGHPVNRRPNYVFGEWDPHHLDNQGRFRRYVIRKITLDALMERVEQPSALPRDERLLEGAAVLAGTILMATGVSGTAPTAHDSATTLATLLPRIARYRDAFYEQLLARIGGAHAERLRQEKASTRQPFGAARQDLNARLARHRATQLQQRYLALLFAEMGYPQASREEADRIQTVSVRFASAILGRLASAHVEAEQGGTSGTEALRRAAARLPEVEDLLRRGIGCGAFADPWNILGFAGLFPLSPAREDSVRDGRLEELVQVVEQTFGLYARLMSEAAAVGDSALVEELAGGMARLAGWWDPFATGEVSDLPRVNGGEAVSSARNVADALAAWHERGQAPADLSFWRARLTSFRSAKAFALVVETLLRKGDYRAALGLLACWLGQAEEVPLEDASHSFHNLALRWMLTLTRPADPPTAVGGPGGEPGASATGAAPRRELVEKFFAYLEANADDYWQVPGLDEDVPIEELTVEPEELYEAAYEEVTYQDSTDDEEGAVSDGGPVEEFDLEHQAERLEPRLRFLSTVARLWQVAARFLAASPGGAGPAVRDWLTSAGSNLQRLLGLLDAVAEHQLPEPSGDYDSLVEYDRRRVLKEQLLYTTIGTCLDTALAVGALRGACGEEALEGAADPSSPARPGWERWALLLERALFAGDAAAARAVLGPFLENFQSEPLLFTPLTEGGSPRQILRVRIAQTVLRALLANLPRLGLLRETYDLLRAARQMEQSQPMHGRGVTEFNHFFQSAYQAVVESVVESAATWPVEEGALPEGELVEALERLTEPFLRLWIEHSRTLQLSVLEGVAGESEWHALVGFVQRYGGDLFHARFLTLGNLRGILHRGVGAYLDYLRDNPDPLRPVRLLDDLDRTVRRVDAERRLQLVLQAVVENYEEYKDYNTTTTQSDYGENLYVLLDILRLKAAYDRNAWQFRPLVLAHEVLARRGRTGAAVRWERSLTQFTRELAGQHLAQLARLEQTHGVRLGTVGDRLAERFVKPLALDRLCALIEPAMREARQESQPAFGRLRQEVMAYTATPTGVGLDVPAWLRRLEGEVHRVRAQQSTVAVLAESFFRVPRRPLGREELQRILRDWERPALPR
jgi:hypothetical protein